MSSKATSFSKIANRILLSLPKSDLEKMLPDLQWIDLNKSKNIYEAEQFITSAYFINSGMVSLIAENSQGGSVEIGVIGNEGILAMELLTGVQRATCRSIVQIPGQALKISGEALKRHSERHTIFHLQLLRFWQVLHKQLSQSVVCNRFHTFEQRLCRWLLMSSAHAKSNDFPFTQEFISFMLGANRTTANAALGELKKSGLIYCKRGLIRILDRKRMEEAACECYQTNMNDLEELYRFQTCRKPRNKNSFLSL